MNLSYKKEKDNDYMILEAPGRPEGSEYQIRMLLLNPISGLLKCKMRKIDGISEFYYDITEKQPMTRAFERQPMKKEDIEELLEGLGKAVDEAGRFLLGMEQFVLKPEFIFRNVDSGEFAFCYLPFYEGSLETDFRELAEYILKRLDHSQEEAVLWGYDIYSRSMEEHFSIGKIFESVHERACRQKKGQDIRNEEEEFEIREYLEEEAEEEDKAEVKDPEPQYAGNPEKTDGTERSNAGEKGNIREKNTQGEKEGGGEKSIPGRKGREEKRETRKENPEKKKREARREKRLKRKREKSEKKIQRRYDRRKKTCGKIGKACVVLGGMAAAFGATAFALWNRDLNLTQAGGILFLTMGILVYFTTVFERKSKNREDNLKELISEWNLSEEDDQTVFLGQAIPQEYPVLVSAEPDKRENIVLDKPKMTVGKQKEQVDILLKEPSVSRVHASLEKGQRGWYLKDLGSTNGTYVNGEKIPSNEKVKLKEDMEIGFSSACYYFHSADLPEGTTTSSD